MPRSSKSIKHVLPVVNLKFEYEIGEMKGDRNVLRYAIELRYLFILI